MTTKIYTIGFTKKSAEDFFLKLRRARPKRLVDVRLNNVSQLAGFSKRDDLRFFLRELCGMDYIHLSDLAPTQDILDDYKKNNGDWYVYEQKFLALIEGREVEKKISQDSINDACLLCSEDKPNRCHRRLVAEYLKRKWGNVEIIHIE